MVFERGKVRLLLRDCCLNGCVLFPLLRCFNPRCTPTIQLGTKVISMHSFRLSNCYLYGERCNTLKTNCGCVCTSVFSYVPWDTRATKLMCPLGHIFKDVCSLTNFVISHLWAVLYDVKASSLNVT